MFDLSVIIPIILMVMTVIHFNVRFIDTKKDIRIFYILFESLMVIGFSYLLFFFGFFSASPDVIIILLLIASAGVILFVFTQHQYDDYYVHWKIVGNALLAFLKIGLPLYLFLTIFRFQALWLQLLLAIGITALLNVIYYFIKDHVIKGVVYAHHYIFDETHYAALYIPIIAIFTFILLFNIPRIAINDTLNTDSHKRYMDFYIELPIDINVDYENELILQINDFEFDGGMIDMYLDDSYIYITGRDTIVIYDRETLEIVEKMVSSYSTDIVPEGFIETQPNYIITADNDILALIYTGLYKISDTGITKISDINSIETDYAIMGNDEVIFFEKSSDTITSYGYSGTLDVISTYDLSTFNNVEMGVFGEVFYVNINGSISIADEDFNLVPAQTNDNLDISEAQYITTATTRYYSSDYIELDSMFYQTTSDYNLRVYDEDFQLFGYHRINRLDRWFILRNISRNQSTTYRTIDNTLYYLVLNHSDYEKVLSLYTVTPIETDWSLPFYSHYSFTTLLFVIVGVLIPYWNTETNYTYVDFVSITNKKKDEA